MNRKERIYQSLQEMFQPKILIVVDESLKHKNHLPEHHGIETHYFIRINARELISLSRIEQHRKIYKVLEQEFLDGLHSLQIEVLP